MPDDPIRAYQAVLRDFNAVTSSVSDMVNVISEAGKMMSRAWYRLNLVNAPGGYGYPAEILRSGDRVDLAKWPDAETVAKRLSGWHELREKLNMAWNQIPESDREGLKEPPSYPIHL